MDIIIAVAAVVVIGGLGFLIGTFYAGGIIKKLSHKIVDQMEVRAVELEKAEIENRAILENETTELVNNATVFPNLNPSN
jgi:branched-subunit amino acid ABC-type transport system permease component